MALSPEESPDDDYFNDLSRQPTKLTASSTDRQPTMLDGNSSVPKPKRIACVLCRKRKLKCDGVKPSCGTCCRLQHDCSYDEVRRKSGPKRGYVKALEARLAQVETLLKGQDEPDKDRRASQATDKDRPAANSSLQCNGSSADFDINELSGLDNVDMMLPVEQPGTQIDDVVQAQILQTSFNAADLGNVNTSQEEQFSWEMIGLGLEEPLPPQDAIDELTQAFFDKIHPCGPMIHRPRYLAAMHLAPHARPPICLRYAMWANAAAVTDKYDGLHGHFYQRARKYIQQDEMRGHGEAMVTLAHAQTWILLATYEFKMMFFPRAWMSAGRASRMTLMMGLHRLDGTGLDVKQCLPPPRDWTEREERRRTFWMSFCTDRYSSIGTGWPMSIEESDIMTDLPVDEISFETSKPRKSVTLRDALEPSGAQGISSFAAVVLLASLFGHNLTHLHRPGPHDNDDDINGEFWKRHSNMDNVLLNTALALPDSLRLPNGLNDPNVVFMNMNIHTSVICLHQAAIFKADKNCMPARISAESKLRCITAAAEIASIMRTVSHIDMASMNPFISFCLYVAARVFVQYLKSRPKDNQVRMSLHFLLTAMHALKRKNPLTGSFLVQLDVDLEAAGLEDSRALRQQMTNPSQYVDRMPGPVQCNLAVGQDGELGGPPAYGDQGLAVYNQPDARNVFDIPILSTGSCPYTHETPDPSFSSFVFNDSNQFEVTSREQRTPGSMHTLNDTTQNRSPTNLYRDMDTSPDESGGSGEQHTPNSLQNNSSHTSNTAYSPPNAQDQQHYQTARAQHPSQSTTYDNNLNFFDPNDPSFTTNFETSSFPATAFDHQQHGFPHPSDWSSGKTGLTPGAPGVDMMNVSDFDWNQMMEGMGDWNDEHNITETGVQQKGMAGSG